ncbi:MAG: murein biosynthesis integral membrane protein MurJ [Actinomycetota bacterium]|nr:murein biosynthesis integral membrane protein MurJ [Actinomycetota bacterium]
MPDGRRDRTEPLRRATLSMAAGTAASRLSGFARLAVLAAVLGVHTGISEAYNLANTTPNMVYDLVMGGVLASTVVPVFVQTLTVYRPARAWRDVSAVVTVATVILAVVSGIFIAIAPWVTALYNVGASAARLGAQERVATELLRLFGLQVLLYGAVTLVTAVLNAERRFVAAAFAPVVNNAVVIAVMLVALISYPHRGVAAASEDQGLVLLLGLGTTGGVAAQLLILLPSLRACGGRIRWHWDPRNPAVASIARLSGWTLGFVSTSQVKLFIVLTLAHALEPLGGATAWTYAYMFFQLPFGIIAVSIMSADQPELATAWAGRDGERFRRRLTGGVRTTLVATVPAAVGYAFMGAPIVQALLAHGTAARSGTAGTGALLETMALGLPGFSVYIYLVRAWQAMQDTKTVFLLYAIENGVNVVLAFALYRPLGLPGLGLALSAAYTVAAVVAARRLRRRGAGLVPGALVASSMRVGTASVAMAAALWWSEGLLRGASPFLVVAVGVALGITVFGSVAGLGWVWHEWRHSGGVHRRRN